MDFCTLTPQGASLPGHLLQVQDVQALVEAVHGGHGGGFKHQQILVQWGEARGSRQALDALNQVPVLALGLAHHLMEGEVRWNKQVWWLPLILHFC